MDHLTSVIWLALWPILIFAAYKIIFAVVKRKGMFYEQEEEEHQP